MRPTSDIGTFEAIGSGFLRRSRIRTVHRVHRVDQLDFFLGKQEASNREGFPVYVADRLSAVKWRNWKVHLIWQENMYAPPQKLPLPKIINLLTDRKEERDVAAYNSWVADPAMRIIGELEASFRKYPLIKLGTPDPYTPPEPVSR